MPDPSNIGKLVKAHAQSSIHANSSEAAANFLAVIEGKQKDILCQLSSAHDQAVKKNREILVAIVDTIIVCGQQNVAIRGHTEIHSNFKAFLHLQAKHNPVLAEHLENANPTTKYTSPDIQNELISICGDMIRERIVSECNAAPFFGFIDDEATDAATMEQMALVLR